MQFDLPQLIDSLPGMAWAGLPDGRADLLNRDWLNYTGLTSEQAIGAGWIDAIHPDDRDRIRDYWRSVVTAGESGATEARLRRHDGSYRWFQLRANPIRDQAGSISRWLCISIDVEDRRRSDEALQANERNLGLIINTIPTHIYVLNIDGYVQFVNQAVMDYTGLTMADVKQEDYRDRVIHPDDFARVRAVRAASLRRTVPFSTEQRVLGKDGQYRWFLVRYKPFLDERGGIVRWYVVAFDIEDHKRAIDQLQKLANMIHSIPAAVWSMTPDGAPDIVNQGWYDYTGHSPDYVRTHPDSWMDTMHPDDSEAARMVYWDGIRSGNGFTMEARFLRARDNAYRWHLNRAVAVRDPEGHIISFVGTSTDIEDLKVAQEELHDTRAALAHATRVMTIGELTASIAHEINQPLSGILTNASTCLLMLADDQPDLEGARETARRTIRDANRASDMITHLRALFTKKDKADEPVELSEATREVIALCSNDLKRKGASLRQYLATDLPVLTGDRIQLQQVILNLLTNAADAMQTVEDRPRELSITTELDADDLVRVTVCDSGAGFDPKHSEEMFKPFFSTKPQGMGIGLSVSRSIIKRHNGRIWAMNNEGYGATFAFAIPRAPYR